MRGALVYRIYGLHEGREKDSYFGAFRTRAEAEARIAELSTREMHGVNWAARYHDRGFVVREVPTETDFEIPPRPRPRERYFVRTSSRAATPEAWPNTQVEVVRREDGARVAAYERNHGLFETFEPFRQGSRELALVSRDYTRTAVIDLASGAVLAEEEESAEGFCPVGFFVPDWWDVHDGSVIPGSEYWDEACEWPTGAFGFVWGCVWGDDSSWKVQHLDLSAVTAGVLRRDERFGVVELATAPSWSPCFEEELGTRGGPPPFIRVTRSKVGTQVTFAVEMAFDLASGHSAEWQRLSVANLE